MKIGEKIIEEIEALYELYGFSKVKQSDDYVVFTYSNGYFYNAEIIKFNNQIEETKLKREFEEAGYSVRIIEYVSLEKTHELLFNGFFAVKNINDRLLKDYELFGELQSKKLLGATYEYVEPKCNWNCEGEQKDLIFGIYEQIQKPGAQLIILEAAAGYGKTCTSYELIKMIADNCTDNFAPIFTELSKNRKAALFRYVLLDEIDRKFTSLSSELVISEIRNGKVPLIIDGFDELISRSNKNMSDPNSVEDDSQTMLDTIAELFEPGCQTKVVLTSRKSAIFTGDIFEEWKDKHLPKCNVTRVSIDEPTVSDWIGFEKTEYLEKHGIPFASIINPILLAFMRSMEMDKFEETCSNVENVISYYFNSLLERERERQSLQLTVKEQYRIMEQIAKDFVEFEIIAEEISFIRDLFIEIIHDNYKSYRDRYVAIEERPTEEEFATKLAGHALLNRISPQKNQIGFINDFIFGILIGDCILEDDSILEEMDGKYIDIACTAYASRSDEKKNELLEKVLPQIDRLNYEQQLDTEIKLANTIQRNYESHYFSNRSFQDVFFDGSYGFKRCTFRNCLFKESIFVTRAFEECSFYDCKFYDIEVIRDTTTNRKLIFSANCVGHEKLMKESAYEEANIVTDNYEQIVLKMYWRKGNRFSRGRLPEMFLLRTPNEETRMGIANALESLKHKNLLYKEGHYWFVNTEKIKEIKEILEIAG
ncbi:hypothetical protein LIQ05_16245 [Blautia glucerasea]|uniref:hypothetical protein n=1 Tax=Blautia glucerasea TaxID=536633 RepID=UPI001D019440|nr:hypothetical protein [Blautia glucerasea]MCB5388524.1 hypothetical protein [Blautia glucerasea]MCB5422859.1 hypothetical protein [Blautia luti]